VLEFVVNHSYPTFYLWSLNQTPRRFLHSVAKFYKTFFGAQVSDLQSWLLSKGREVQTQTFQLPTAPTPTPTVLQSKFGNFGEY